MIEENIIDGADFAVDFLGNKLVFDCMGCAIADAKIKTPGGIIYDGKNAVLVADPEIPIPGFFIVNTKRHVKSFSELTTEERHEVIDIVAITEKALKELKITKDIVIVQEERAQHFHVWIFSYHDWMNAKFGKGIQYLRDILRYARDNSNQETIDEVLITIEKVKNYIH